MQIRTMAVAAALAALVGCEHIDEVKDGAGELTAGAVNRYCQRSPEARTLARRTITPHLDQGVEIEVRCPKQAAIAGG